MSTGNDGFAVRTHFAGKDPIVRKTYDQLLKALKQIGPINEESKKTSIHLVHASALAGVATRKSHLILTIKSDHKLESPRIHKSERVSAKRIHHEIKLTSPEDVDGEVKSWLRDAYVLSA